MSAGGVAAYIWSEYLSGLLDQSKTKYFVAPDSGFSFSVPNYKTKTNLLEINFKNLYLVANKNIPLPNPACI